MFVDTPLTRTHGVRFKYESLLVPILRSGLVLLSPFLRFHPSVKVGFIGMRSDEITATPELYYCKLPSFNHGVQHHLAVVPYDCHRRKRFIGCQGLKRSRRIGTPNYIDLARNVVKNNRIGRIKLILPILLLFWHCNFAFTRLCAIFATLFGEKLPTAK